MNTTLVAALTPLGPLALVLLVGVAFAETALLAGFLLPADTLLVTAGVLVAGGALQLPVWLSLVALTLAAVAGDQVAYAIGQRLHPKLQRGDRVLFLSRDRLDHARSFFDRHGSRAVIVSRFVPVVRTLTPVVAGAAGMNRRTFTLFNILGAAGWAVVMFGGGFLFGAVPLVADNLEMILLVLMVLSALPLAGSIVRSRKSRSQSVAVIPG